MAFPTTLRQLEHALGFFGYYRKFVPYYAALADPLVLLKTRGFKDGPRKKGGERTRFSEMTQVSTLASPEELERANRAFGELRERLCSAPTLMFPDFDRDFILYVDGSRERGFGAALHQIDLSNPDKPTERPILLKIKEVS